MALNRQWEALGILAIAAALLMLFHKIESDGRQVAPGPNGVMEILDAALSDTGLRRRDDVVIEMNGREVAHGFSRADCDGLLLVSALPRTAQGWAHIAPRLDLAAFDVTYIYDGIAYERVPRLMRLGDRLLHELGRDEPSTLPRLAAVAEAGGCGLALRAATVLKNFSRGNTLNPEGVPAAAWNRRGSV